MGPIFVYCLFLGTTVAAVFRPWVGAAGYVVFVALCPQFLWRYTLPDPNFPFQRYLAAATLLGVLLSGLRGNHFRGAAIYALWGAVGYYVLCYLSAQNSIKPDQTAIFMDAIWKIILMLVIVSRLVDTPGKLNVFFWIILLAVGWNAWEINMDYLRNGYSLVNQEGYGWGMLNANGYALILLLVFSFGMSLAVISVTHWTRAIGLLIAILCLHAVYIVESRGSMVGGLVSLAVLIWLMPKTRINIGMMGLLAASGLALAGPPVVKEFFSSFEEERDVSAESRFYVWSAGIRMSLDYPWLGLGPWASEYAMGEYYDYSADRVDRKALHNLPLEVATGSGIPSLMCYLVLFFGPAWALFRRRVYRPELAGDPVLATFALGWLTALSGYWFASLFNSGALIEISYVMGAMAIATVSIADMLAHQGGSDDEIAPFAVA